MIAARWRSAILRSAFALRTALVAAVFLSADVFTPTPIFAAEDESSVGGESLILTPSPSLAELGDESFHSLISPTANTAIADTDLLLRHRDSWRRRLGLRTQSAMESLVGIPALADAMRRLESGDLLLKDFSHRAGNAFFNAAADFSANEIQRLAGLDSILKRIEIGYDSPLGQHDGSGRADIFLSLWEDHNTLLFGQLGGILQERDNRWEPGGNVGLGLRFQAGAIIFGGNAFFDYLNDDNPGEFRRYSVGLEALTSHADWSINLYQRISDVATKTTDAGTFIVYTAEGWDSEIALRIPGAEWLELAARRYEWERERSGKLVGFDYRLSFLLLESFSLDATFDAPEDGDSDWGVNARFHFDLTDGFRFRRASAESLTDPWHRRYESVRRRYEQRIIEEITILPPPPPPVMTEESDTMIREGTAIIALGLPDALSANGGTVEISVGMTSTLSANQSGTTSALSAQSGTTPALSANQSGPALSVNDFEPNARTCNDRGVCEWIIVTVASAGESTAGEVNCVIDGDGCRISIILSPPPALLTQDSIIVEITEAGGFPLPEPLILEVDAFEVEFSSASAAAFAEGSAVTVSVSANAARTTPTIITIALGDPADTATPIADYQLLNSGGTVISCDRNNNCAITISANAMMEQIQITALADSTAELTEAFSLTLIDGSDYALATTQDSFTSFTSRIIGDIAGVEASIQFTAANLTENLDEGSAADITVQANAVRSTPTTVTILLVAGTTATPGTDYRLLNSGGTVISCDSNNNCAITISANAQNEIIQITAFAEGESENVESFSLMLIDGSDYALDTQTTFTGMISSIDGVPIIQFTADALGSPLAEDSTANIVVRANVIVSTPLTITISLGLAADAATPDTDYQLLNSGGTVISCVNNNCAITISAGAMMEQIQITARADSPAELAEAFSLTLVDTNDYNLGGSDVFTGMISNVGGIAAMRFSTANITTPIAENSSAVVAVNASAPVSTPTTVTIALVAGTAATPMTDYQLRDSSGTAPLTCVNNNCAITLAANTTVASFRISATDDSISELAEAFSLMLIEDSGVYALGTPDTLAGAIASDVAGGVASMEFTAAGFTATLGEGGSAVPITVQANAVRSTPTIVTISLVTDLTGASLINRDYQLRDSSGALTCDAVTNNCAITISANMTVEVIQITALANTPDELAEAFSLTLIDGIDYNLDMQTTFAGEIASDIVGGVASMEFSAANLAATLEEGGIALAITVQANAVRTTPTIVTISVVSPNTGDAIFNSDYRLLDFQNSSLDCSGNLCEISINANAEDATFQVIADTDTIFENVESFTLSLVLGSDYNLDTQQTFTGNINSIDGTPIIQFVGNALSDLLRESIAASVTVQAIAPIANDIVVTIALDTSVAATPNADYRLLDSGGNPLSCNGNNCFITISSSGTDEIIQVMAISDSNTSEPDEPFSLSLVDDGGPGGGNYDLVSSPETFTGIITDTGGVHFSADSVTALATALAEGSIILLTVETDTVFAADTVVTISLGVATDTATPDGLNADYELRDSSGGGITCDGNNRCPIIIPANMLMASFQLSIIANALVELPESFSLMLVGDGSVYELVSPDTLRGVIQSDLGPGVTEASMQFTAAGLAASLSEGGNADITVRANAARTTPTIVTVSLVADNAAIFDTDYELFNVGNSTLPCNTSTINSVTVTFCTVIIPANGQNGIIEIRASVDTTTELAEAFSLMLIDGDDYNLGSQDILFTDEIASDLGVGVDEASMRFTTAGLAANLDEGTTTASSTNVIVEANAVRTTPTIVTISVGVTGDTATPDDPATADFDGDYRLLDSSGTPLACDGNNNCAITIAANVTVERIQITARLDDTFESVESFSLTLVGGGDYALVSTQDTFTGMIDNEDGTPIIQFVGGALSGALLEGNAEPITVQAIAPISLNITVTIALDTSVDATPMADYRLFDSDGTTPLTCNGNNCLVTISSSGTDKIIQVMAIADTVLDEADEPFSLMLIDSGAAYDLNSQNTFTGIISDAGGVHFSTNSVNSFGAVFVAEGSSFEVSVVIDTAFDASTVVTISLVANTAATPNTDYELRDSSGNPLTCDAMTNNCDFTIPMDVTTASFTLFVFDDSATEDPELPEAFSLMLVESDDYDLVLPTSLNGVIESDLGPGVNQASMEFSAADLTPILDEGTAANIIVQANAARTTPTTVTIVIAAGNAAIFGPDTDTDADYQLLNSASPPTTLACNGNNCAITISANAIMEVIQITAHADSTTELADAFSLMLIAGSDYALGAQTTFTDEIQSDLGGSDDEASMQFTAAALAANLDEGTAVNIVVRANAVRATPTIVTIAIAAGNAATYGSDSDTDADYQLLNSSDTNPLACDAANNCAITISANMMMEEILITAHLDDAFEIAESFSLMLIDGDDYALDTQVAFGGMIDNGDGTPIVQFTADAPSAALAEGTAANIIVQTTTPAAPVFADTVVTISLVAGTTATPDDPTALGLDGDYRLLDSSDAVITCGSDNLCAITISAGAMMEQIQITVDDDATPELTEAFSLVLIEHIGVYALGTQNAFGGEITGDIAGTEASVQFTAATGNLNEGGNAFIFVEANAARNTPTTLTISVGVTVGVNADTATPDNPATADFDGDYRLVDTGFNALPCDDDNNCTIILAANSLDTRFLITARLDDAFENAEDFSLALIDDGDTYDLDAQDTLSGTITSIDGTPIIRLVAASLTGVTEGNAISITVQAIAPITLDIIVTISLGVDTDSTTDDATPMTDYRLFDSDGVTPLTCDTDNLCAITISADETDEVIQIMAITDSDTEEDESFLLTLIDEGDTTYDLVTDNALLVFAGTINAIARVQFSTANTVTIAEGFTSTNLAVSTSAPVESPITITIALVPPVNTAFATPDDPARAGFDGDYALLNSVGVALTCTGNNCLITIAMGEMMAPFQITAIDDASGAGTELAEPFRLTLIDGVTYNLATPDSLTGEIASNVPDGEARMQFSPAALLSNLDEGNAAANIVVRADFPRSTATTITIELGGVSEDTATPDDPATADFDEDYRLLDSDGTPLACDSNNRCAITLDAAARTETFQIIARLDDDFENVESFSLVLIDGDDYALSAQQTTFTGNIDNRDGTPIIQFAAASLTDDLTEGSATVVIVQATAPVVSETIVIISLVAVADATTDARPDDPDTISVDGDYQLLDSAGTPITCDSNNLCRITFDAGDSEVRIQVRAVSDTQVAENNELFSLRLIDDGAYNLGSPFTFTGTIANVAIPIVQFSTANLNSGAAIDEGTSVDFEVTSIAAVGTETFIIISVGVSTDTATPDDPATADFDGDYRLLDSSNAVIPCDSNNLCRITLDANVQTENLKLTVREDSTGEEAESFSLTLIDDSDPTYNLGSPVIARGTIVSHPRIVITENGARAAGAELTITVTFEPPLPASLVEGLESVNLQIRGYANFVVTDPDTGSTTSTDFTSIAPTNFRFDGLISGSDPSLGRRSTYTFTGANVQNPSVAAITLNDSISGQTIEIRISAAGAPIQTLYSSPGAIQLRNPDNSHYSLTVTFP